MNSSSTVSVAQLNLIQLNIVRYFLVPSYVLGNFGNMANIVLFSQTSLRSNNVCAWYFISLSLANLLVLNTGGLTRIISISINFNLETVSIIFCKIRNYLIQSGAVIGRYFICLISIERWMATSRNRVIQRMNSGHITQRLIIIGPCIIALFNIHIPVGFQINNKRCYASLSDQYVLFFNIYNIIIILVPTILMTLFSILTFVNVRNSRNRIIPISSISSSVQRKSIAKSEVSRQRDIQFIQLALIQVLTFLLFTVGYGIYNVYDFATSTLIKSPDRLAIEAFISGIGVNLNYASISVTFYSYTLASITFRRECFLTICRYGTIITRCFEK